MITDTHVSVGGCQDSGKAVRAAASQPGYGEEMEAAGYPVNPMPRGETVALADKVGGSVDALRDLPAGLAVPQLHVLPAAT